MLQRFNKYKHYILLGVLAFIVFLITILLTTPAKPLNLTEDISNIENTNTPLQSLETSVFEKTDLSHLDEEVHAPVQKTLDVLNRSQIDFNPSIDFEDFSTN